MAGTLAAWPVNWTAIIVGALAAVVAVVIFGLIGTAIGAHKTGVEGRITAWSGVGFASLVWEVLSAFFAFVLGGWIAARLAGLRRAEDAALHGALATVTAILIGLMGSGIGGWLASGEPMRIANYRVRFEPTHEVTRTSDRTTRI